MGQYLWKYQLFWCELQGYYWFWHTGIWIMKLFRRPWRGHEEDKVWHWIDTCWVLMIHVGHDHVECWELWWRLLATAVPNPLNSGLKAVVPCSFPGIAIADEHDLNLKITWPESQIHVMGTQCDAAIAEPQKAKPTCCSTSPFASVVRIVKGFFFPRPVVVRYLKGTYSL